MSPKELALAASMMSDYADTLSNRTCNDWDFPDDWTREERIDFATRSAKSLHAEDAPILDRNGEPMMRDSEVAMFLAELLEKAPERIAAIEEFIMPLATCPCCDGT